MRELYAPSGDATNADAIAALSLPVSASEPEIDRITIDVLIEHHRALAACRPEEWALPTLSTWLREYLTREARPTSNEMTAVASSIRQYSDSLRAGISKQRIESTWATRRSIDIVRREIETAIWNVDPDQTDPSVRVAKEDVRRAAIAYLGLLQTEILPRARSEPAGLHGLAGGDRCYEMYLIRSLSEAPPVESLIDLGLDTLRTSTAELVESFPEAATQGRPWTWVRDQLSPAHLDEADLSAAFGASRSELPSGLRSCAGSARLRVSDAVSSPQFRPMTDEILFPKTYPQQFVRVALSHEGIPGHLLQRCLLADNTTSAAVPGYGFAAFSEGWAMVAEQRMPPLSRGDQLGKLEFKARRAARLIVDAGIHGRGWSLEEARQFLRENSALTDNEITEQIERILQAPGYDAAYLFGWGRIDPVIGPANDIPGLVAAGERLNRLGPIPLRALGTLMTVPTSDAGRQ